MGADRLVRATRAPTRTRRARPSRRPLRTATSRRCCEAGDATGALDAFELALASRERDDPRPYPLEVARYSVGKALRTLGRPEEAAAALEPGATAAIIVWENHFLAPIGAALRRSGGQLVATGRIPIQDLVASLDLVETAH